jgi:hypothetical protein
LNQNAVKKKINKSAKQRTQYPAIKSDLKNKLISKLYKKMNQLYVFNNSKFF